MQDGNQIVEGFVKLGFKSLGFCPEEQRLEPLKEFEQRGDVI